jgi:alcohol dehydrogenase
MPTQVSTATMKAVQVGKKSGSFERIEKEIPQPGPGHVRIQVKACGICHALSGP